MMEASTFRADFFDYAPNRMTPEEIRKLNLAHSLIDIVGNKRQYVIRIAMQLPPFVEWYSPEKKFYFKEISFDNRPNPEILFLSGSGLSAYYYQDRSMLKYDKPTYEILQSSQEKIKEALVQGSWVMGICFGGQLAIHALGGQIGRLPANKHRNAVTEAGWLSHELTQEGRNDPVFSHLPNKFCAPHLHSDFIARLPMKGTIISTSKGSAKVIQTKVLATRNGYLGKDGLMNTGTKYIHASVVIMDNGARLYQIQPHPEMATPKSSNFLVRMNPWIMTVEEMGGEYYQKALAIPDKPNYSVARVITNFALEARKFHESKGKNFIPPSEVHDFSSYLIE